MPERDVIFISHATPEGNPFTLWLGAKLSALGYEVWADTCSTSASTPKTFIASCEALSAMVVKEYPKYFFEDASEARKWLNERFGERGWSIAVGAWASSDSQGTRFSMSKRNKRHCRVSTQIIYPVGSLFTQVGKINIRFQRPLLPSSAELDRYGFARISEMRPHQLHRLRKTRTRNRTHVKLPTVGPPAPKIQGDQELS